MDSTNSLANIALTLFLVTNPIGNSPAIIAQIKDFSFERQRMIVFREAMFALLLALIFQFFGELFLSNLSLKSYSVSCCGGILLFLVALKMIFPLPGQEVKKLLKEPFLVPIATPLLSGAGLLSIIMLYAQQEKNTVKITSAILLAWVGVTLVLVCAPYLKKILGKRGLLALEQLMGMMLALMSMEMIVKGVSSLIVYILKTS